LAPTFFLRNATPRSLSSLSLHGALPICNVVGFGTLPARYMALTCYWSQSGSTVEADIMFNKADYRWATRVKSGCRMTWDVQAVATHEFGHAFGLAHVTEGLHGHLTMAPYILPCQTSESRPA